METRTPVGFITFAVAMALFWMAQSASQAQIIYVPNKGTNSVGAYNASTGQAVPGFSLSVEPISVGFGKVAGVAASGNMLYVIDVPFGPFGNSSEVGEYDATTGAPINRSFITDDSQMPLQMAVSGTDLYVWNNSYSGTVGVYNATTGAVISGTFISGVDGDGGMAILGSTLYLASSGLDASVSAYNTITGEPIDGFSLRGLTFPSLAISGTDLCVETGSGVGLYNATTGAPISTLTGDGAVSVGVSGTDLYLASGVGVSEYNATTGALISGTFITGQSEVGTIFVSTPVPEPAAWALVASSLGLLYRMRGLRRT